MKLPAKLQRWLDGPVGWARVVMLMILAGGVVMLAVAAIDASIIAWQCEQYVKVPCYLEASSISREGGRDHRNMPGWEYVPVVTYRYKYNGQEYVSDRVCSRSRPLRSLYESWEFQSRFGPGTDVECYVNPDDPEEAMLELPTQEQAGRFAKFGGFALMIGIAGIAALQLMLSIDTRPSGDIREPGWGEIDSGPRDALARSRKMLRERLESH